MFFPPKRFYARQIFLAAFGLVLFVCASVRAEALLPVLATNLICRYDFDHAVATNAAKEQDLGRAGADLNLINGGATMRVNDGAYPGSYFSLQTQQVNPTTSGNDDWKAGFYQTNGVPTLSNFNAVAGITLMGWVKPTGTNPNLDTTTAATNDFYNAIGLFGLLAGNSEGHAVRALLEIITVGTNYQLVALGRRIDGGSSLTLVATNDWHVLLPSNTWTHLAATFDFDNGTMALYRNGALLPATNTSAANLWNTTANLDVTTASNPAGIKIGGSFPQNTAEKNAFNGRFDDLMFFNRAFTAAEVAAQFTNFSPKLSGQLAAGQLALAWPAPDAGFTLETKTNLGATNWTPVTATPTSNAGAFALTQALLPGAQYFRLKKP
ncbi:MAG: hypothetical protein RLZZ350_1211 [Verrucomicrobiota bacterium]|jgi:hypothetical protein